MAPDVVLTAAHCYTDSLSVVANGYSSGTVEDDQIPMEIAYSIRHPEFDGTTYENDMLLLRLESSIDSPNVGIISLNFDNNNPMPGDDLITMGLGDTTRRRRSSIPSTRGYRASG